MKATGVFVPQAARLAVRGVLVAVAFGCSAEDERKRDLDRQKLLDPDTCQECHADHYREWSGSMHAYASKDPVFLAMNARGQEETGGALGDFCVRCHAPMAVEEKLTSSWESLESLPEWAQGITCYFCHNAESVVGTHNNQVLLASDTTLRGGIRDPFQNAVHDSAYSPLLDGDAREESSSLCGSCHDIVIPATLSGGTESVHLERTYAEWQASLFNREDASPLSCSQCHTETAARGRGPVASAPGVPANRNPHRHDFIGVDVALTPFPEMDAQRAAVQRFMETTLRVAVCVSLTGSLSVTLENIRAGHNVPSGATQDRRLWVEVRAFDATGAETFAAGVPTEGTGIESIANEPNTWLFRDETFDREGAPTHMFWNVARVEQGTILAPVTTRPLEPGYHREVISKTYLVPGGMPARATVLLRMRPMGQDVLGDLVESGHLAPDIAEAMPTFDLLPNRLTRDSKYTLEWTYDDALENGYSQGDTLCLETAPPRR